MLARCGRHSRPTPDAPSQVINQKFCSFKTKTDKQTFCRNEYNLTGLCNRTSCPLANSQYATIRETDGRCASPRPTRIARCTHALARQRAVPTGRAEAQQCAHFHARRLYLCMKTIERAWSPKNLWERVLLSKNYAEALGQIDTQLEHWPEIIKHKCKQRLTKMTQYLIRMRKLRLKPRRTLERVHKKVEVREKRREAKAEKAALIDRSIQKELLGRLQSGTYGDIYNFPMKEFESALEETEAQDEEEIEEDDEFIEESDDDEEADGEEEEAEYEYEGEGGELDSDDEEEDSDDDDDDGEEGDSDDEDGDGGADDTDEGPRKPTAAPPGGASTGRSATALKRAATASSSRAQPKKPRREPRRVEYEQEREMATSNPMATAEDW